MYSLSAREPFPSAARTWLDGRSPYIRPVTRRIYLQYIHTMADFLHEIKLKDIRPGTIRAFQDWRLQSAGAVRTNAEAGCLQQILKEAGGDLTPDRLSRARFQAASLIAPFAVSLLCLWWPRADSNCRPVV